MSRTKSGYGGREYGLTREELAAAERRVRRPIAAERVAGTLWEVKPLVGACASLRSRERAAHVN